MLSSAGSFGVSRFGDLIYPLLAPKLGGLLLEQFFDFPVGGVDDDAAWTSFMWNRLAEWLVYGPPPDDPPPNLLHKDGTSDNAGAVRSREERKSRRQKELKAKRAYIYSIRQILNKEQEQKKKKLEEEEEASSSLFEYKTLPGGVARVGLAEGWTPDELSSEALTALGEALICDYLFVLYPELKQSLTEGSSVESNSDPTADMKQILNQLSQRVAGLQEEMKQSTLPLEEQTQSEKREFGVPIMTQGGVEHEYFATSLATMRDGRDVLVGSPGAGVAGGPQQGSATLFLNTITGKPSSFSSTVHFEGGHGIDAVDAATLSSYERFGWSSTICDVNRDHVEDVVLCAPSYLGGKNTTAARGNYTGRCDVFYGPFDASEEEGVRVQPDLSVYGDKEWGNFGYSVTSGDVDGDGFSDLVVSAPFAGRY